MSTPTRSLFTFILILGFWGYSPKVFAVADKENQGRWTKPTEHNLPDKEVPGFLVNLGPTGARAVLTEKSFIVKYIFAGSPAVNRLKIDDEIVGVFGKPFSAHQFGGGHGYEGPIMELGEAIEKAESKDGKLVLNLRQGSGVKEIIVQLEPIGAFSANFPYQCNKSKIVRAKALKYFAEHPDSWAVWQAHARSAVALALLSSDQSSHQKIAKEMILKWSGQDPDPNTWTWDLSYKLITLSEYYLLTKDSSVLESMKKVSGFLEKAQYSGKIVVWTPKPDEDPAKINNAQQLYDGGFGHAPYRPSPSPAKGGFGHNGYGPMQYTTILAVTAWQLAGRCGVNTKPECIRRALDFIHRGTNAAGYVAYGGEFTLNNGYVDPVAWKNSTDGDNYVGRTGAAMVAHQLSPEFNDTAEYMVKYRSYAKKALKSMPDGHADSNLGIMWGLMGAAASQDESILRATLDYHKAFFNTMRCFDGSFVLQPGRDYADNGYYMASRYHPTATMILTYGLESPKLLTQGIQVSIPGVNPKALSGKLSLAYQAIVEKSFVNTARIIKTIRSTKSTSPEDLAIANALMSHVDEQFERDLLSLKTLEQRKDYYALDAAFVKLKATYGALDTFKDKTATYEEGLKQDPWKAEVKIGARYVQLLSTLRRSRSASSLRELQRFAEKYPDSLYGTWASEVVRKFSDNGEVVDPSLGPLPAVTAPESQ